MKAKPLSERLCDGMVLGVAAWTLCCNATVLAGGGLRTVVWLAGASLAIGFALVWRLGRSSPLPDAPAEEDGSRQSKVPRAWAFGALAAATALAGAAALGAPTTAMWWFAVLVLGVLAIREWCSPLSEGAPPDPARHPNLLLIIVCALGLLPLGAHRASPDDGYYLNIAVHAVDEPDAPLLTYDTLHGVSQVPIMYAVYKTHSFEILGGAVAWLTGLTATQAIHWVLPSFFGLFFGLAWAVLLRRLSPRSWLSVWLATLAVYVFVREGNQFHAAFGLLRLHQGKAVFVSVFLPLLLLYGMEFVARPTRRGWLLLAAAQVASIGMTSTALWAAPLVAAFGLAAGAPGTVRGLGRTLLGLSASSYVVLLGLYLARTMLGDEAAALVDPDGVRLVRVSVDPITASNVLVGAAWRVVFGEGAFALAALFAMVFAWAAAPSSALRRVIVIPSLATLLLLANPYFAMDVAEHITGGSTYWRVLWLVPIPLALGVSLSLPARIPGNKWGGIITASSVALFILYVPHSVALFGGLRWKVLGLKVPGARVYDVAEHVVQVSPPGSYVLAPGGVATWIVSIHNHPYPLSSRANWMNALEASIGSEEANRRRLLLRFVTGYREPAGPSALRNAIRDYPLASVTVMRGSWGSKSARAVIRGQGFTLTFQNSDYETWTRP